MRLGLNWSQESHEGKVKCSVLQSVLKSRTPCFQSIPIPTGCVILGNLLTLSKPWFPHLHNEHLLLFIINNSAYYCNRVCGRTVRDRAGGGFSVVSGMCEEA